MKGVSSGWDRGIYIYIDWEKKFWGGTRGNLDLRGAGGGGRGALVMGGGEGGWEGGREGGREGG
jgi:hypothetical protein